MLMFSPDFYLDVYIIFFKINKVAHSENVKTLRHDTYIFSPRQDVKLTVVSHQQTN